MLVDRRRYQCIYTPVFQVIRGTQESICRSTAALLALLPGRYPKLLLPALHKIGASGLRIVRRAACHELDGLRILQRAAVVSRRRLRTVNHRRAEFEYALVRQYFEDQLPAHTVGVALSDSYP